MLPIQHIFTATDLSMPSLHAVDRGFQLAQATGARCTVMHALGLDALGPLRNLLGDKADDVTHRLSEHQHIALQALVQDPARHRGVKAAVQVEPGIATSAVPASAAAAGADLVLVGAKGDSLLRQSDRSVLVVVNPRTPPG
jgi:nucleotide-binding universal stress UspA family protein